MCGRYVLALNPGEQPEVFDDYSFPLEFAPRYNIAPSQPVLAIPNDGKKRADFLVWGLIPAWAKDPSIGNRLINARGETLAERPAFRGVYKHKRCLIPADGFYEWKYQTGSKTKLPHFIHMKSGQPFAFAGLWDEWRSADGSAVRSCTIITTAPNSLMAALHNRMPVILRPEHFEEWLDPSARNPASLEHLIQPFPAERMDAHPVSTLVNTPANDRAECIAPA